MSKMVVARFARDYHVRWRSKRVLPSSFVCFGAEEAKPLNLILGRAE